ncbi:hypothetical protein [Streptomyces sp. NPDC001435]|uniref:hypothetical protein n=1 Tax=unclassified Streptomyces TaxID=2593676 RepID=UPI003693CFB8
MRTLLVAILRFLLPARGAHRAEGPVSVMAPPPASAPLPSPGHRPALTAPRYPSVVFVDGLPLVRPYVPMGVAV